MDTDHPSRTEPADAAEEGYPLSEPEDASRNEVSDEERALFLARHGAEALLADGHTELQIDELALRFVRTGGGGGVDEFIAWVRKSPA